MVGSTDYEVFGATRSQSGTTLGFGYTGEQSDLASGPYLRARTLDPALGRFLQSDTVRPGGPGSLGYNLYAYAQNNPATWVDPSGHQVAGSADSASMLPSIGAILVSVLVGLRGLCIAGPVVAAICTAVVIVAIGVAAMALIGVILQCSSVPGCLRELLDDWDQIKQLGSAAVAGLIAWTIAGLASAVRTHPANPDLPAPSCRQGVITVPPERAAKVDREHTWNGAATAGKSVFYDNVSWRELVVAAQGVIAIPDPGEGSGACLRAAHAGIDVGVSRRIGSTSIYAVVTFMDGRLITTYPGPPVGWSVEA